jgi:AAA15 family ATPase/GTPase
MIQSISIENFRCFDKTEIKGFQRMNLITGKNNSGKTCLLEALYFMLSFDAQQTGLIRDSEFQIKDDLLKDWLFNSDNEIIIFSKTEKLEENLKINNLEFHTKSRTWTYPVDDVGIRMVYQASSKLNCVDIILDKDKQIPNNLSVVRLIDDSKINGYYEKILEAVKTIDEDIEDLTTYASYPNILYVKKKGNKKYLPVSFFGDAMQKILRYVSVIFRNSNNKGSYLLIDEIENGIHYTAQKEVWQMLFKLCQHFDIQLFATTHSLEMIKAFEEVCEEFEGEGAYFEMARHAKTNQIIGIKHQIATLEYELETNATIRGE